MARARFIDDLVAEQAAAGVKQYVILGAGLDTFAQRQPDSLAVQSSRSTSPAPRRGNGAGSSRSGYPRRRGLRFVPVDFESGQACRKG